MDQAESLRNIIKKQEIDEKKTNSKSYYGYIRQRWRR